jgi:sRNA-binding protein
MAIGIQNLIVERLGLAAEAERELRLILYAHVNRPGYQRSLMTKGAIRLDLNGVQASEVTKEHRRLAREKLIKLRAKGEP